MPDAVSEFNLTTNQFSAEYGHAAGGQFSLVTKTGTNNWHGSGEWYNQNRNYNSLDNLTKGAILDGTLPGQPAYDNNRFGGRSPDLLSKTNCSFLAPMSTPIFTVRAHPLLSLRPRPPD